MYKRQVYKRRVVGKTKTGKDKVKWERNYRSSRPEDDNSATILARLTEKLPEWEALDIIPNETYGDMYCDRSKIYGVNSWRDLFSPRQLLSIGTSVEVFSEFLREEKERGSLTEAKKASFIYLAFAIDKIADYNARLSYWDVNVERSRHVFGRHDFSFMWAYAELALLVEGLGLDWTVQALGLHRRTR